MRLAQVCHRFHALVCSRLRFLDLSSSGAHHPHHDHDSAAQQQPSSKRAKLAQPADGLARFLQHVGRNCHNLRGLVLPPKVTSGVHLERAAGMKSLTSLSLYGCSAHLAALAGLERLHACGTYTTLEGLACLPSPVRETAVVHQEHSLFIFPGMTEALSMQRKGISYNPFSLFSTSLIPSIHKNVRRLHETIAWLEKRQMVLDRRIRDKSHYAKHYIRINEREKAMAALRRKKMYVLQRDRIDTAGRQLADSLLAFQIGHDLGLILAPDTHEPKRRANEGLQRVDRLQRQIAAQAERSQSDDGDGGGDDHEGASSSDEVDRKWETERERLLREYRRLELEVAAERHVLLLDSRLETLTQQTPQLPI